MVITEADLRVSLVGGGTDYEKFFQYDMGRVISFTINRPVRVGIRNFDVSSCDVKYLTARRMVVRNAGTPRGVVVDTLDPLESIYVGEALRSFIVPGDLEILCLSDRPEKVLGLGWSGSFVVALIKAFLALDNRNWDPKEIAERAYGFARNVLGEPGGKQDQYAAAFGGFNYIEFKQTDMKSSVAVRKCLRGQPDRADKFLKYLMMFDTGLREEPCKVLSEQQSKISSNFRILKRMSEMVLEFKCELEQGSFEECGKILHRAWNLKKRFSSFISNPSIDALYDTARSAGALGGKILGPGGGGFLLFVVKPEDRLSVRKALSSLEVVEFVLSSRGVRAVMVD